MHHVDKKGARRRNEANEVLAGVLPPQLCSPSQARISGRGVRTLQGRASTALGVARPRLRRRVLAKARTSTSLGAAPSASSTLELCRHELAPGRRRTGGQLCRGQESHCPSKSAACHELGLRRLASTTLWVARPRLRGRLLTDARTSATRTAAPPASRAL